jgi:hypothetical protein
MWINHIVWSHILTPHTEPRDIGTYAQQMLYPSMFRAAWLVVYHNWKLPKYTYIIHGLEIDCGRYIKQNTIHQWEWTIYNYMKCYGWITQILDERARHSSAHVVWFHLYKGQNVTN